MTEDSTPSNETLRMLIRTSLKRSYWGTPSEKTLDFIRKYSITEAR